MNRGTRCFLTGENRLKLVPLATSPSRLLLPSATRPCLFGEPPLVAQASCWSRRRTTRCVPVLLSCGFTPQAAAGLGPVSPSRAAAAAGGLSAEPPAAAAAQSPTNTRRWVKSQQQRFVNRGAHVHQASTRARMQASTLPNCTSMKRIAPWWLFLQQGWSFIGWSSTAKQHATHSTGAEPRAGNQQDL